MKSSVRTVVPNKTSTSLLSALASETQKVGDPATLGLFYHRLLGQSLGQVWGLAGGFQRSCSYAEVWGKCVGVTNSRFFLEIIL